MSNKKPKLQSELKENDVRNVNRETLGLSQRQIVIKRFVSHKAAMASLITLIGIVITVFTATGFRLGFGSFAVTIPGWWPFSITDIDPEGAMASV
jgi:peptide/nickel transport system permease protein